MSLARWTVVIALGLLDACGSSDRVPPPSSATPPLPAAPPTTAPSGTVTPRVAVEALPTPTAEQRRASHDAIVAARASARAERWPEASASFAHAVELDPTNARLRCEAGYAAYRGGDLERADAWIDAAQRALPDPVATPEPMRVPVAMCLYNAGLVHEARGRADAARTAYAQSLALRPNPVVQRHLDLLGRPPSGVGGVMVLDGLDDDAIDARAWAVACNQGDPARCVVGELTTTFDSTRNEREVMTPSQVPSAPFAARVITFRVTSRPSRPVDGPSMTRDTQMLVVREGTRARAARVSGSYVPDGLSCPHAPLTIAWRDVIPGGAPELVVDARGASCDQYTCSAGSSETRALIVCAAAPLRCAQITLTNESHGEAYCGEADDDGPYVEDPPTRSTHEGFRIDFDDDGHGAFVFRPTFGSPPVPSLMGAQAVANLLTRSELRWTTD